MALSKEAESKNADVIQVIAPRETKKIQMGIEMEAIAHLLDRLTDLYPNPIEATVREVISNAYDATVLVPEALRKPIRVTCPTSLNAVFVVEDFGIGMSSETVENVYSKYGASTKMLDFKQIGAYGLGAKAPLAYCTEFVVETVKDSVLTVFSVSRTKEGNFTNIIREVPTDKPNGTKVTIPVKHNDSARFSESVNIYKRYAFDADFIIDGELVANPEYTLVKDDFILDEEDNVRGRIWIRNEDFANALYARLAGNSSSYAYNLSGWLYKSDNHRYTEKYDYIVELKPGVVNFSSSRDAITLNERQRLLDAKVTTWTRDAKEGLQELLEVYKTFSDEKAAFVSAFILGKARSINEQKQIDFNSNSYYHTVEPLPLTSLTTHAGFSPTAFFMPGLKANAQSALRLRDSATDLNFFVGDEVAWFNHSVFRTGKVTQINQQLLNAASVKRSHFSFADLAGYIYAFSLRLKSSVLEPMIIVREADQDSLKKILSGRKALSETEGYENALLVFTQASAKLVKDQIVFMEENYSWTPIVKTASEVLASIKNTRASTVRAKVPVKDETFLFRHYTDGVTKESEVERLYTHASISVARHELDKTKALVIIGDQSQVSSTLIGLANSGVSIIDRPIYGVDKTFNLKAPQFKALQDYDSVYASRNYEARSKAAKELVDGKTYYGRVLNSTINNLTPEVSAKLFIDATMATETFFKEFKTYLNTASNNKWLHTVELIVAGYEAKSRTYVEITEDQLDIHLKEHKEKLLTLKKFFSEIPYAGGIENSGFTQIFRSYAAFRDEDRVYTDFVMNRMCEKLDSFAVAAEA